jgi:hypothetical protein
MPIKNYSTVVPANRSIEEIQTALIRHGAVGMLFEYEQGTGKIAALKFKLAVKGTDVGSALPVEWRAFQAVLKQDTVKRWNDEDYVYRVAWCCIRDWVLAQLALDETRMVEIPQVFLPFAMGRNGRRVKSSVLARNGKVLSARSCSNRSELVWLHQVISIAPAPFDFDGHNKVIALFAPAFGT